MQETQYEDIKKDLRHLKIGNDIQTVIAILAFFGVTSFIIKIFKS